MQTRLRPLFLSFSLLALPAGAQQLPSLLQDYCVGCHNAEDWAGSLDMESLDFQHVAAQAPT